MHSGDYFNEIVPLPETILFADNWEQISYTFVEMLLKKKCQWKNCNGVDVTL